MAIKILGDLDVTGSMNITASDVPNLDTAKITTGTFADARVSSSSVLQHISAGSGLDLSGGSFSVEEDLRDGITHIGVSSTNYITFDNGNNRIDFYAGGVHVGRLEEDGDLHIKGDVIAFSSTL